MSGPESNEHRGEDRGVTRRSVLAAASVGAFASITPVIRGSHTDSGVHRPGDATAFDPTRHGFGFYNWRIQQGPYPEPVAGNADAEPGSASLLDRWREPFERTFDRPLSSLPDRLLDAIGDHAREGLLELTQTDGYCYGMVFAAQRYFERPETIPGGFGSASEITHPNAPVSTAETPILDEIIEYHTAQYLDFYAWFGRYAMFQPAWIDYERQLQDLTSALDVYGTAGLTLVEAGSTRSHQVLVYDYDRRPDHTIFSVYDPNYPADAYEDGSPTIAVDTSGSEPVVEPIDLGSGYEQFIHNEYDRAIRARSEGRTRAPVTAAGTFEDHLFGGTLFVATDGPVRGTVIDPDGRPLDRTDGDRTVHYRYGAPTGTYILQVTGRRAGDYAIEAYAGSHRRDLLDETLETTVAAGETHRYGIRVGRGDGTLERV